jgi:hypothetical protein
MCSFQGIHRKTGLGSYWGQTLKAMLTRIITGQLGVGNKRTDIGKYSFINRTIINWNQLPADLLASFPRKLNTFRKSVKKVVTNE